MQEQRWEVMQTVWHQPAGLDPESGAPVWYTSGAPFERIATDITRLFPVREGRNHCILVAVDCITKWPELMPSLTKRHQQWQMPWWPTSSATSGSQESCTIYMARALSLDSCNRCCSAWEYTTHGPPLFTCSQGHHAMICECSWGAPKEDCFGAAEKLSWRAAHLPAGLPSINLWDHRRCLPSWYSEESCFGFPLVRSSLWLATWQNSWICCMSSSTMCVNIWRQPVTGQRPATTMWLIVQDARKETKSGCPAQPGQEESHLSWSSSYFGNAHTRHLPRSVMLTAGSSNFLEQSWWWYAWTDWCHT